MYDIDNNLDQPLVSILMPAYNAEQYIQEAIDSTLSQTYKNIELIICNDCSTDDTLKIISSFQDSRITIFSNELNQGYLRTFNKLLTKAKGKFITFLDADDIMPIHRIEKQLFFMQKNKDVGLVGTNYGRITDGGKLYFESDLPLTHEGIIDTINQEKEFPFCGSSVMIKDEIYNSVGGYREFFVGSPGEDIDWILRISEKYKVANIEYIGYLYRFSTGSITRKPKFEFKSRHIKEIIFFLAKQRKRNSGKDDLMTSGKQIDEFIENLKYPYIQDPSLIYRKVSIEYAIQKDWKNGIKYSINAIVKRPFNYRNYMVAILNIPILILPSGILLKLKLLIGINHVSSKV